MTPLEQKKHALRELIESMTDRYNIEKTVSALAKDLLVCLDALEIIVDAESMSGPVTNADWLRLKARKAIAEVTKGE